ncbi:AfsR/SARP family transcriptional regulator [Actinoplanes auranticolor]|nr:AfsR/SARP family transcriptional regulator [Actinoplanes auranticolor]
MLARLLLAEGRVLSDYQLGEILWAKNPPETYQAQIYTYASRLRQRLGTDVQVVRKGCGYGLRLLNGRFDYHEFTRLSHLGRAALQMHRYEEASAALSSALDLWQGPTLTDVTDHLIEAEGPAIEEARMEALEGRITADLALGRHQEITAELVGLLGANPLRERLRAQLMLALYECDRQADAFAVFHDGRLQLEEELGVDPGATLLNTYQAILTGDLERLNPHAARSNAPSLFPAGRQTRFSMISGAS